MMPARRPALALAVVAALAAAPAWAAPVTVPIGFDLDGNGSIETEGSMLSQQFTTAGATLGFNYMQ
jgi:hypothetical protein